MKNYLFLMLFLFSAAGVSQEIKDLQVVGPLHDGFIPVMKNNQWGFINSEGDLVVDFRDDLVHHEVKTTGNDLGVLSQKYPMLSDGMAIVNKKVGGITYYGFIDATGKVVIEPQYLNVSNFNNGQALALKIEETFLGRNNLLDIKVKSYKYDVVLLDKNGEVLKYLSGPFPVSFSKEKLRKPPAIEAKWISPQLITVRNPGKKWEVFKI
ncbi:MAG: WG repeat-containing protein [Salinimicrobium sediminis]|nr:WG repeat-containing protein [Salinimicrobium sediminis]